MRFLRAIAYLISGIVCLEGIWHGCGSDVLSVMLLVASLALSVAAMAQFVQGIYDVSDKRKMLQATQRAAWNALQASGKE